MEFDRPFTLNTLVELDVKFPGQPFIYRSRGMVAWTGESGNPEKPHRLGITVFGMQKLDPAGVTFEPAAGATPTASQVSQTVTNGQPQMGQAPVPVTPQVQNQGPAPTAQVMHQQVPEQAQQTPAAPGAASQKTSELKLPKAREVSELMTNLIGEKVAVSKATNAPLDPDDFAIVGDFNKDDGTPLVLCIADIELANWLGAALAMIPKGVAEKDVETSKMSEETRENTQEILNIATSLINVEGQPHLRFGKLHMVFDDEQTPAIQSLMDDPAGRVDFSVDVPGYGSGMLCFMVEEWQPEPAESPEETTDEMAEQSDSTPQEVESAAPLPTAEEQPPSEPEDVTPQEPASEAASQQSEPGEEPSDEAEEQPAARWLPPKAREVADLLTNLVGDPVGVKKLGDNPLDPDDFASVGSFVDDSDQPIALVSMDISLANCVAAALAMIPAAVVKKDIENWKLSEDSVENIQEILNIASSLFNKPDMPHLRFQKLFVTKEETLPPEIQSILDSSSNRRDFDVEIPGYGTGGMSCMFVGD